MNIENTAPATRPMTPAFQLVGRTALITGAGAGIGEAIAFAMAEAGANVVLVARTLSALEDVAERIAQAGYGDARIFACDVRDTERLRSYIESLPNLDILVNNAGTNIPEPFVNVSEEHLDDILTLNVRSLFLNSQSAVRKMLAYPDRRSFGGSVINITSQMGHVGAPNRTAYCMSKHAIEGLTKALAVELAAEGIRVNSIAPTFVDTPLIRRIVDTPEKYDALVSKIPIGAMARVEDIMGAAVFLASPAAGMITGTSLLVDGGWTAQ